MTQQQIIPRKTDKHFRAYAYGEMDEIENQAHKRSIMKKGIGIETGEFEYP